MFAKDHSLSFQYISSTELALLFDYPVPRSKTIKQFSSTISFWRLLSGGIDTCPDTYTLHLDGAHILGLIYPYCLTTTARNGIQAAWADV